jgi:isoquinoline 1-oxidoreductase
MTTELNRRDFLKSAGAAGLGLTLYFTIPGLGRQGAASAAAMFEPNAMLTITPDGLITVHITKAEMGQGVGTALAQIVGEELEADWKDIRIDYPINDPKYGLMLTGGSWSINWSFDALSRAGAATRIMLIDAAAKQWNVPAAECVAVRSVIRHTPTGRSISYGDLVAKAPITKTLSEEELKQIKLKTPATYKLVGKSVPRLDIPEKTNGRAKFGIDTFLPNMVYAKVAYPPTREGGKHTSVDDSAAKQVKGYIQTVVNPFIVAVIADSYEAAVKARDALKITWDPGPLANVSSESIFQDYARKVKDDPGIAWVDVGDIKAGLAQGARTHSATYTTEFVGHMQIEPMNCVARFENGVFDIYTGAQFQTLAVGVLAHVLKVEPTKIRIHQQYLGGGFGRRLEFDIILEGAIIASQLGGRPVKLIRSREEDLRRDFYRTPTLQVLKAGLATDGKITAWEHTVVAAQPGTRWGPNFLDKQGLDAFAWNGADHVYDMPNHLVRVIKGEHGIPVGYVRSVAPGYTFFAIETFLDEIAHLAKMDPVQMRLRMLSKQPRLAHVLRLVAARSEWGKPLPKNVGRGIVAVSAQEKKTPTWTATALQARVDPNSGQVRVDKVICAVDCGTVVHPDSVRAQVEGSIIFGLSMALKERGTISNGALAQSNFHDYQVLRMNEAPEIEVHIVESAAYPTGIGEPGTTTIAPALSNAIFAATGARLRSVPFLPERVLNAIKENA